MTFRKNSRLAKYRFVKFLKILEHGQSSKKGDCVSELYNFVKVHSIYLKFTFDKMGAFVSRVQLLF